VVGDVIRICLAYSQTLKIVEVHSTETLAIFYQTTQCHIPGNSTFIVTTVKISNSKLYVLWRNRPMREVITFRNLKERDCATVAGHCRVLPPLPSFHMLLGYAVITWSRKSKEGQSDLSDVTRNNTQR
jgi:hypothetical protein